MRCIGVWPWSYCLGVIGCILVVTGGNDGGNHVIKMDLLEGLLGVCVMRYCTCALMIPAKVVLLEHMTVGMWVHYTSGIASYKALQKGSFKKPWYCLNIQSQVSYFANIMCQICLFCSRLQPLHHPLYSCPCHLNSLSSLFLLCFILAPPRPPSHF